MLKFSRDVTRIFGLAFAMLILQSSLSIAQVSVSLPNVTGTVGAAVAMPITVSNLDGQGVRSYQFVVTYNPHMIKITGADISGTLSSAISVQPVVDTVGGKISVAAAGSGYLGGVGTLINLDATILSTGTTALTFQSFMFNEGTPTANLTNGSVGTAAVSVSVPALTDTVGQVVLIPINADSTLTGQNVYSYQFNLAYDTSVVQITGLGYSTTGTISPSSMTITAGMSNPGTVSIAAAGAATLSGKGVLVYVTGVVVGAGKTSLTLSGFEYNEGTPSVGVTNGSLTSTKVNHPPKISSFTPSVSKIQLNASVTFAATASDPDLGDVLTYTWSVNGTTKKTGADNWFTTSFSDSGKTDSVKVVVSDQGGLSASNTWVFKVQKVQELPGLPKDYSLGQNYPNPFNPTTSIKFDLPNMSNVRVTVYDILGKEVRTLVNSDMGAGRYSVTWDGLNDQGQQVTSGVYFYRMDAGTFTMMKKMLLLK